MTDTTPRHGLSSPATTTRPVSRRGMLGGTLATLVGAGAVLVGCGSRATEPATPRLQAEIAVGGVAEVRAQLAGAGYVRHDAGRFYLLPAADEMVIAVTTTCAHEGCPVPPPNAANGGVIACPCHGSRYDGKTGGRIGGPAERPLDTFPVRVVGGAVIVDTTGAARRRTAFSPDQATLLP